jgi:hypothetical protein
MINFLPLSHPTIEGLTRVPIYRDPPLYTIRLSEDFTRVFTEDSLPDYIRSKIVIADAGFEPNLGQALKAELRMIELTDLFIYRGSFNLQDIGWRYDKNHYIVVLNSVEFNTLLGKDNNGDS